MLRDSERNIIINTAAAGMVIASGFLANRIFEGYKAALNPIRLTEVTKKSAPDNSAKATTTAVPHANPLSIGLLACTDANIKAYTNDSVGSVLREGPGETFDKVGVVVAGTKVLLEDVATVTHIEGNTRNWAIVDLTKVPHGNLSREVRVAYMRVATDPRDNEAALIPNKSLDNCKEIVK